MALPSDLTTANRLTTALTGAVERQLPANAPLISVGREPSGPPLQFYVESPNPDDPGCEVDSDAMHVIAGITWTGGSDTRLMVEIDPEDVGEALSSWCDNASGAPSTPPATHGPLQKVTR